MSGIVTFFKNSKHKATATIPGTGCVMHIFMLGIIEGAEMSDLHARITVRSMHEEMAAIGEVKCNYAGLGEGVNSALTLYCEHTGIPWRGKVTKVKFIDLQGEQDDDTSRIEKAKS